ncbi:MAG: ERCC4 domain-containing protein [Holophaga sp.]|nr:ERCC4 domain-containing protein [Holophaga sp.]
MHETPMRIFVDDRESRSRVLEYLEATEGTQVIRKRLKTGDYLIEDRVIAERKRIPDFLTSLCDGRLFNQASALTNCGLRALLILEGHAAEWNRTNIRREAIQGALLTLGVIFDLQVLRAQDEAETAQIILFAARQLRQNKRVGVRRPGFRPKGKRARQLYILTSLPRVGSSRAKTLLDHFGSNERIVTASETELRTLSGIGPQTAKAIHNAVREDPLPYH